MSFNFTYKNIYISKSIPSLVKFNNKTNELMTNASTYILNKHDCIISYDKKTADTFKEDFKELEVLLIRVHQAVNTMNAKKYKYIEFDEDHENLINITKNNDGSLSAIDKDDNVLNILYIQQD